MNLPESYVLDKFFCYSGDPVHKKYENVYNAGCPICKEGNSWGSKKRLYFYPETNTFYCFNCSRSWSALNWICEASNITKDEVYSEIRDNKISFDITKKVFSQKIERKKEIPILPYDSINLFDDNQKKFYSKNKNFSIAYELIEKRKLNTAINKSPNLYLSLTDFIHKNRLCIPFYDRTKKIIFYQTRSLDNTFPKYLSRSGSDKSLFGIEKVDPNLEYIFIFEGPIDSMFVKNGISAAGLSLNDLQKKQLNEFPFHKKIWVLDNPSLDETAKRKTKELIQNNKSVFMWKNAPKCKDFNDWAIIENCNEIPYNVIIKNCFNLKV
jgi:hypothetical protein